jgi:hypothetical protein
MEHGTVRDIDQGTEHAGVLRDNGSVAYVVDKVTRYAPLWDFAELGLQWTPLNSPGDMFPPECRTPVDSFISGN